MQLACYASHLKLASQMTPPLSAPPVPAAQGRQRILLWTLASFLVLVAWDLSGLDLWMAQWFGSRSGFALEAHWFWRDALHDNIRHLPWLLELALLIAIGLPFGNLKKISRARRTQLGLTTLAALLVVSGIKTWSNTSCPWDLQQFGGVANYISHWDWGVKDGGNGGCFPAGHASAGFAFIGGFFAFRHSVAKSAWRWFAGAMLVGLVLGIAQQVRGAHYMSHTLWTAWLCWTSAALIDYAVSRLIARKR